MGDEIFGKNDSPWTEGVFSTQSTSIPRVIEEESKHVAVVIICVISAILVVALLFVMAVFIDCRQQKLQNLKPKREKRLRMKLPIPRIGRPVREDEDTIVDKMQNGEPSSAGIIV